MSERKTQKSKKSSSNCSVSYKEAFWVTADEHHPEIVEVEYKHDMLSRTFLKSISDTFEERKEKHAQEVFYDPQIWTLYLKENELWIAKEAA